MKVFFNFIIGFIKDVISDDISSMAAALTYKLLFSFFPFLIFLITLLAYLPIDEGSVLASINGSLPDNVYKIINNFIVEVINVKHPGMLSISLLLALFSTSSGIVGLMHSINKAYGIKDKRNFFLIRLISLLLLLGFILGLVLSLGILVFGDTIQSLLVSNHIISTPPGILISIVRYISSLLILTLVFFIIYKLSITIKSTILPGALFASIGLSISSYAFNIYINNFANYSKVYGSIAGIFILILWLNLISLFSLLGGELNGYLYKRKLTNSSRNINIS